MSLHGGAGGAGGQSGAQPPEAPAAPAAQDDAASTTSDIDALAAEVAAGRLTPRQAIDRLVDANITPDLNDGERAELRELLTDLVENDPYFAQLTERM